MAINFICKGCGTKFNNIMQSKTIGYCFMCNEFFMQKYIFNLRSKLAESEEINKLLEIQLQDMERSKLAWENKYFKLEQQLSEK